MLICCFPLPHLALLLQEGPFYSGPSVDFHGEPLWGWVAWALGTLALGITALGLYLWRMWPKGDLAKGGQEAYFRLPEYVGPYLVDRLLGHGAFASTYLAYHEVTRRKVAIKILHPFRCSDPEYLARFQQEARLGLTLNHPNIVRILDIALDPLGGQDVKLSHPPSMLTPRPPPFTGQAIIMEYVNGQRLDRLIGTPIVVKEAVRIALGIAQALTYAHAHGVVHRDIKPGNVILSGCHVKVMDFGVAKVSGSDALTATYTFLGTPRYAAPELQRDSNVGFEADWYSLGIILFELLTGQAPFQGKTPFEVLQQHREAPLPDLAALRPDATTSLTALVHSLCSKQPSDRPSGPTVLLSLKTML